MILLPTYRALAAQRLVIVRVLHAGLNSPKQGLTPGPKGVGVWNKDVEVRIRIVI